MNHLLRESAPEAHTALLTLTVRLGLSSASPLAPGDLDRVAGNVSGTIDGALGEGQLTSLEDGDPDEHLQIHHLSVTDARPGVVLLRNGQRLSSIVSDTPVQVLDVQFEESDHPSTLVEGFEAQVDYPEVLVDPGRVQRLQLDAAGTATWRVELAIGESANGEGGQWHTEILEVATFASAAQHDAEQQAILTLQETLDAQKREVAFITPYHAERVDEDEPTPAA